VILYLPPSIMGGLGETSAKGFAAIIADDAAII
jgi:hypothetical protein